MLPDPEFVTGLVEGQDGVVIGGHVPSVLASG